VSEANKAVWFNLDSLIDPNVTGGRVPSYKEGQPEWSKGHLALEDNGWKNQVTMYALQGLANRNGPRLMYDTQFWNWRPADQTWRDYYAKSKGIEFETLTDMYEVIDRFRGTFKGLIVHDPSVEQSLYAACTLAGLDDLLPVRPDVAETLTRRYRDLKIIHDLIGRWQDEFAPLDWAIDNLMPRCEPGMIYSVDNLWTGMSIHTLDLAVARKAFVFRCSTKNEYAEDNKRIWRIHSYAGPNCGVFGWGEPEDRYCQMASLNSNYIMCTEAPNLSFHAKVPTEMTDFRQKSHVDKTTLVLEEDKCYVAFMTTEGDALKIHMCFQGGAWHDSHRGKVPINWGFQPRMLDVAPAMAEYYYSTMTDKDHFFCGCSGAGYTYPNWMPEPEEFFRETDRFMEKADLQTMDCWIHFCRPVYERYAELSPHTEAFILPCGPGQVKMTRAGTPVILRYSGLHYFPSDKTAEDMAAAIRKAAESTLYKPAFLTVFAVPDAKGNTSAQNGFCPEDYTRVAEILGDKEYKIVTLEEMAWAAGEFARKYPDRANRPQSRDRLTRIGVNVISE
jgi:hypothetical protein